MCYSLQSTDRIFVKGYGFLFFAKYVCKHIEKKISKKLSRKYSQKFIGRAKKLQQMHLKLFQRE